VCEPLANCVLYTASVPDFNSTEPQDPCEDNLSGGCKKKKQKGGDDNTVVPVLRYFDKCGITTSIINESLLPEGYTTAEFCNDTTLTRPPPPPPRGKGKKKNNNDSGDSGEDIVGIVCAADLITNDLEQSRQSVWHTGGVTVGTTRAPKNVVTRTKKKRLFKLGIDIPFTGSEDVASDGGGSASASLALIIIVAVLAVIVVLFLVAYQVTNPMRHNRSRESSTSENVTVEGISADGYVDKVGQNSVWRPISEGVWDYNDRSTS